MNTIGWLVLAVVGAGACADPQGVADVRTGGAAPTLAEAQGASGVHQAQERAALREADLAHAAASAGAGAAGFLASLADDALFLLPRSPLAEGKAAAEALLAAPPFPFDAGMKLGWTPSFVDVSVDANVGYSFGNVRIDGGAVEGLLGQYIAFWRRQPDGSWAVEAWSFSGAGAEPGELPPFFGHPLDNGRGNFTPVDVATEEAALLGVDALFAQTSVELGQAEAFRRFADQHAITLAGGEPDFIIGRKAIFESRQGGGPDDVLNWTPRFAGVGPLGDLGYSVGDFVFTSPEFISFGKYLTIWQKSPNGSWKFMQDGGSSSPPPAP
jgi:ketosteroid isomerase-like protein